MWDALGGREQRTLLLNPSKPCTCRLSPSKNKTFQLCTQWVFVICIFLRVSMFTWRLYYSKYSSKSLRFASVLKLHNSGRGNLTAMLQAYKDIIPIPPPATKQTCRLLLALKEDKRKQLKNLLYIGKYKQYYKTVIKQTHSTKTMAWSNLLEWVLVRSKKRNNANNYYCYKELLLQSFLQWTRNALC